jgi:hypothetical protein
MLQTVSQMGKDDRFITGILGQEKTNRQLFWRLAVRFSEKIEPPPWSAPADGENPDQALADGCSGAKQACVSNCGQKTFYSHQSNDHGTVAALFSLASPHGCATSSGPLEKPYGRK